MYFGKCLLVFSLLLPLFGIVCLLVTPNTKKYTLKATALSASCLSFTCLLVLVGLFQKSTSSFQFVVKVHWLPILNLNFTVGLDGISLTFMMLTALLIPLCILLCWSSIQHDLKQFLVAFLFLEFLLLGTFSVLDLLLFYVFFESVLIPMFLIIGIWGSRERKILAGYYFFIYTLVGSVIMLLALLYVYCNVGTASYEVLLTFFFTTYEQKFMWLTFLLAFGSKVPMLPVHLWLPEAHVEAPTAGSVILAGVLLKLGTYGFIRYSLPLFPQASFFFSPLVYTIAVAGVVFASFTAIRQTDFKRIIAYTSIAHMNLVILGIFSFNVIGLEGAVVQSLSHGFVASALFVVIGVVYDRYRTRVVQYYGGLGVVMPLYVSVFLFFTLANISFPGTSSFVGEFMIFVGSFAANSVVTFIAATSVVLGGVYSLWLFNRFSFGNLKFQYTTCFLDLNPKEVAVFVPLIAGTIALGVQPDLFIGFIRVSVSNLVELLRF